MKFTTFYMYIVMIVGKFLHFNNIHLSTCIIRVSGQSETLIYH